MVKLGTIILCYGCTIGEIGSGVDAKYRLEHWFVIHLPLTYGPINVQNQKLKLRKFLPEGVKGYGVSSFPHSNYH